MASQADPRQLIERAQASPRTGGDPAQLTSDQRNAGIARLLTRRVIDGTLPQADRDRLGQVVAAEYDIAPEEATRRLQQVEQQATETADAAATASAVAADLGARMGTRATVEVRRYA